MPVIMELAAKISLYLRDMLDDVRMIYAEKGIKPFTKPMGLSAAVLLALYSAVYVPLGARVGSRADQLASRRVIASRYSEYDDAKTQLIAYQRRLPLLRDKEDWLNSQLTSTARNCGISFDSQSIQTETEIGSFLLVSREVTITTTYSSFGKWIAELERTPMTLKVAAANIRKDTGRIGFIKVSMKLSTIFPKFGGAPGGV